jgi:hypothetical protein
VNWKAVRASARLDFQRNRTGSIRAAIGMDVGIAVAWIGSGVAAMLGVLLAVAGGGGMAAGCAMAAGLERYMGRVAWWRTYPVTPTTLMLGRLLAVAVRGGLLPLVLLAIIPMLRHAGVGMPSVPVVAFLLVVLALVSSGITALLAAVALRYRVERVFIGLFALSFLDSMLLDNRLETALGGSAATFGRWLIAGAEGNTSWQLMAGAVLIGSVAFALGVMIGSNAITRAEERTVAGPSVDSPRWQWRGLRYPAGMGSAISATLMMQLRLSADRLPQQLVLLVGGALLLPFLPENLASFLGVYLPIIALGIPATLAMRTAAARRDGTLEAWATLPIRREAVVAGTVGAVVLLALLATGIMVGLRVMSDRTMNFALALGLWGSLAGGASLTNGMAAWFKPRHVVWVMLAMFVVVGAVAGVVLVMLLSGGGTTSLASIPPLIVIGAGLCGLLVIAPLGGALYGRGLERFELVRK